MQSTTYRTIGTSECSASGISTGTITNLPSGVVGMEESIDGENMFSVQEGMAKVFFPASTPEEVFYNPGIFYCHG